MGIGLIQPMHLLLILVIVLVVFGAGKLSQVGGALGQSVKDFKATVSDEDDEGTEATAKKVETPTASTATRTARPAQRADDVLRREEV